MASRVFDEILTKAARQGVILNRSAESNKWLRDKAFHVGRSRVEPSKMMRGDKDNAMRMQYKVRVGHMYMFTYDAKNKETLPFWDKFPLIFPFRKVSGGFYGLNMHYLPYRQRAFLMDALEGSFTNNNAFDETTRLRLNYNVLAKAAKYRFFKPCVKHYLDEHVTSRFIYIYPAEWQTALFLPTDRFQKATNQAVWRDSASKW